MTYWRRNMNDRIDADRVSGKSDYGDRTYGAKIQDIPARVEYVSYTLQLQDEEVLITHQIATEQVLAVYDRVYLPGETNPRIVRQVKSAPRLRGNGTLYIVEVS